MRLLWSAFTQILIKIPVAAVNTVGTYHFCDGGQRLIIERFIGKHRIAARYGTGDNIDDGYG